MVSQKKSAWHTKKSAAIYLQGAKGAIPAVDLQFELIRKIVESWCPHGVRVLDLGCGDGAIGRMLIEHFPNVEVIFADFSEVMLKAVRNETLHEGRASVIKADFSLPDWIDSVAGHKPFDIVVSGLAIHHLPDRRKRELYAEIFGLLDIPGVFLNMELVSSATPAGAAVFQSFCVDCLYRFHRATNGTSTRVEIEETYHNRADRKEDIFAPVDEQCRWLREIGFEDVDCFFKVFQWAIFGGRKTSNQSV